MITIEELTALRAAYRCAYDRYLGLCQMHEQRMASSGQVKAARAEAQRLEGEYNWAVWQYQQQAMNAKPAGGRQRA